MPANSHVLTTRFGTIRAQAARTWPMPTKRHQRNAHLRRSWPDLDQNSPDTGQGWPKLGQAWPHMAVQTNLAQIRPMFPQRGNLGQIWLHLVHNWLNSPSAHHGGAAPTRRHASPAKEATQARADPSRGGSNRRAQRQRRQPTTPWCVFCCSPRPQRARTMHPRTAQVDEAPLRHVAGGPGSGGRRGPGCVTSLRRSNPPK